VDVWSLLLSVVEGWLSPAQKDLPPASLVPTQPAAYTVKNKGDVQCLIENPSQSHGASPAICDHTAVAALDTGERFQL